MHMEIRRVNGSGGGSHQRARLCHKRCQGSSVRMVVPEASDVIDQEQMLRHLACFLHRRYDMNLADCICIPDSPSHTRKDPLTPSCRRKTNASRLVGREKRDKPRSHANRILAAGSS